MRAVSERERRLTRLGYRALALVAKKQHLGDAYVVHMADKAGRLFEAAIEEWKAANVRDDSGRGRA